MAKRGKKPAKKAGKKASKAQKPSRKATKTKSKRVKPKHVKAKRKTTQGKALKGKKGSALKAGMQARGTKRKLTVASTVEIPAQPPRKKQKLEGPPGMSPRQLKVASKLREKAEKAKATKWVGPPIRVSHENEYASASVNAVKGFKVLTKLAARPCTYDKRPPIDVVCVVDRSGSMGGRPLELVKSTLECVTENISERDRLAIVSFGSDVKTVLPLTNMDTAGLAAANKAIQSISISGSTALCSALLSGMGSLGDLEYVTPGPLRDAINDGCRAQTGRDMPRWVLDIVAQYVQERADIASVFLLTDGEANIGIREPKEIVRSMKGINTPAPVDGWWQETKGPFEGHFLCIKGQNGWYGSRSVGLPKSKYHYTNVNCTQGFDGKHHVSGRWQWSHKLNDHRGSFNWTIAKDGKSLQGRWSFDWDVRNAALARGLLSEGELSAVKVEQPPSLRLGTAVEVRTDKKGWQGAVVSRLPGPTSMMNTIQVRFAANKQLCDVPQERLRVIQKEKSMPCTVNTFGFGAQHNDRLLRDVSQVGSGMYYYIEGESQIDESFGDCLGGLLTMLGKDIRLTIEAAPGVAINRVHTSLACKCTAKGARYEVLVGDIQGEECRDLVVDVTLPKRTTATHAYTVTTSYYNLLERKNEMHRSEVHVPRAKLKRGKRKPARCVNVDVQCHRMTVAALLAEAAKAQGDAEVKKAKAKIEKTIEALGRSPSGKHAVTKGLVKDLQECKSKMHSAYAWRSVGSKAASKYSHSHTYQRSTVGSRSYVSRGKGGAMRRFKKSMRGKGHRV